MQRTLLPSDIETHTTQAMALYRAQNFPQDLCEKIIEMDIKSLNRMLTITATLENNPRIEKIMEILMDIMKREDQLPEMFKGIGCSDEQYQQIKAIASQILNMDVAKRVIGDYQAAINNVGSKMKNMKIEEMEEIADDLDFDVVEKFPDAVVDHIEHKSDKTEKDMRLLKDYKEIQNDMKEIKEQEKEMKSFFLSLSVFSNKVKSESTSSEENSPDMNSFRKTS